MGEGAHKQERGWGEMFGDGGRVREGGERKEGREGERQLGEGRERGGE